MKIMYKEYELDLNDKLVELFEQYVMPINEQTIEFLLETGDYLNIDEMLRKLLSLAVETEIRKELQTRCELSEPEVIQEVEAIYRDRVRNGGY